MFFLSLIAVVLVACVVLWIINTYLPFDGVLKKIFNTAVALAIMIWILKSIEIF
ncbi:Thivi_2564 family membrane protein [Flavobacterium kayseriense]|uniref:Thivi_2564 family membrane protein n=1 Tax=Flavobacterium kayseriense TaxID=2764714 RepID=UPI0037440C83